MQRAIVRLRLITYFHPHHHGVNGFNNLPYRPSPWATTLFVQVNKLIHRTACYDMDDDDRDDTGADSDTPDPTYFTLNSLEMLRVKSTEAHVNILNTIDHATEQVN